MVLIVADGGRGINVSSGEGREAMESSREEQCPHIDMEQRGNRLISDDPVQL